MQSFEHSLDKFREVYSSVYKSLSDSKEQLSSVSLDHSLLYREINLLCEFIDDLLI